MNAAQEAARALGRQIRILNASNEADIDKAFAILTETKVDGLVIGADAFFIVRRDQLVALAAREAVPAIYPFREFAAAGGLTSHGASLPDQYRQVGNYTGKILQGAKPNELPVLHPTKYELVINLATTRILGLQLPPTFLT